MGLRTTRLQLLHRRVESGIAQNTATLQHLQRERDVSGGGSGSLVIVVEHVIPAEPRSARLVGLLVQAEDSLLQSLSQA